MTAIFVQWFRTLVLWLFSLPFCKKNSSTEAHVLLCSKFENRTLLKFVKHDPTEMK